MALKVCYSYSHRVPVSRPRVHRDMMARVLLDMRVAVEQVVQAEVQDTLGLVGHRDKTVVVSAVMAAGLGKTARVQMVAVLDTMAVVLVVELDMKVEDLVDLVAVLDMKAEVLVVLVEVQDMKAVV